VLFIQCTVLFLFTPLHFPVCTHNSASCTTIFPVSSTYHYFILVGKQSIAIRVSACLSICLSVCPLTYLDNHKSKFHKILCTSPVAMARSYDGTTTRYVLRFVDGVTPIGQNQRQCYVSSSSLAAPFRCQTMLH